MKTSPAAAAFLFTYFSTLFIQVWGNLRCYSCAPCNEFDYFAGSLYHFEADCYFDRYCMKVTGRTTDIFGYQQEVSFRGCPWISVLATLEEGCTESAIAVAGAGVVEGIFCLCRDHLCNAGHRTAAATAPPALALILAVALARLLNT